MIDPLAVFFRGLHVITACVVIGSAVFMRLVLPAGLRGLDPAAAESVFLRCRRGFKMIVHSGILLFLVIGIYNAIRAWPTYNQWPGVTHGIFGIHVLLALIAWAILLYVTAGRELPKASRGWMKINLVVLALTVAAASTLKFAREYAHDHPKPARTNRATMK